MTSQLYLDISGDTLSKQERGGKTYTSMEKNKQQVQLVCL